MRKVWGLRCITSCRYLASSSGPLTKPFFLCPSFSSLNCRLSYYFSSRFATTAFLFTDAKKPARAHTSSNGDAVFVDLGNGKNLVALLAHIDKSVDLDGVNFLALRAYKAAGRNVSFNDVSRMAGAVPVTGALIPALVTFANLDDPASARRVEPDDLVSAFGQGFRLKSVLAEAVPNGLWPLDFGGALGEPVTRGIGQKLKWLNAEPGSAETAIRHAGLPIGEPINPREVFTRN